MAHDPGQHLLIAGVDRIIRGLAPGQHPYPPGRQMPPGFLLGLEQFQAQDRRDGARDEEGCEQGDGDREDQRHEQQLGDADHKENRQEDDHGRDRRGQDRHGHFAGGVEHRLAARLARYVEVTVDVLELHDRIVHKTADGEGEPAQGEDIEGLAEEVHGNEGQQEGQGNGNRDDDGRHE